MDVMPTPFVPSRGITVAAIVFAVLYLTLLWKRSIRAHIDLYDLVLLSMAAILPLLFVVFPNQAVQVTGLVGVTFPFLVLFGGLLVVVFVVLHRLTVRLERHERMLRTLVQELALSSKKWTEATDDASQEDTGAPR